MERRYGLPVAVAAAVHAALLFGFTKSPRAAATVRNDLVVVHEFRLLPPDPDPLPEPEPGAEKTAAAAAPAVPLPGLVEPPALDLRDHFTVPPPPLRPVSPAEVTTILERTFGVADGTGTAPFGDVLSGLDLDNPPRTRLQAAPIYPFESKREGVRGEVTVEFIVDEAGAVRDPRVVRSSHRVFEEPTLRAVAKWKFEPGRRAGRVVPFRMAVPVVFSLHD